MDRVFRAIRRHKARSILVLLLVAAVAICALEAKCRELPEDSPPVEDLRGEDGVLADPVPLGTEELQAWEEKLKSGLYNGFVSRMYTNVRHLPLGDIFSGCQEPDENGEVAVPASIRWSYYWKNRTKLREDCTVVNVVRADEILREATGLSIRRFRGGFGMEWSYDRWSDSYFCCGCGGRRWDVAVIGGTRQGNTLTLELDLTGGNLSGMDKGTMTVVDGKIVSFTNPVHAAAERAAWEVLDSAVAAAEVEGAKVVSSYLSALELADRAEVDGRTYTRWDMGCALRLYDLAQLRLDQGVRTYDNWIILESRDRAPGFIVSEDKDGTAALEGRSYAPDRTYRLEEYLVCRVGLGMELGWKWDGWPAEDTEFLTRLKEGDAAWALERDSAALEYLKSCGKTPDGDSITVLRNFEQPRNSDIDEGVLLQVDCGDGPATLLMFRDRSQYVSDGAGAVKFWQVNSVLWADGTSAVPGEAGQTAVS